MSAGQNYAEVAPFRFDTGVGVDVKQYVFVTVDEVTDVATVGVTEDMNGVTVQPSDTPSATAKGIVAVHLLKDVSAMPYVRVGAVGVTRGDELGSDANGYAIAAVGATGVFARRTIKAGALVPVYTL